MKLARYEFQGKVGYGVVEGDGVRRMTGDPFGKHTVAKSKTALSKVELLAPCQPSKALAMALNYRSHLGNAVAPKRPEPFL